MYRVNQNLSISCYKSRNVVTERTALAMYVIVFKLRLCYVVYEHKSCLINLKYCAYLHVVLLITENTRVLKIMTAKILFCNYYL